MSALSVPGRGGELSVLGAAEQAPERVALVLPGGEATTFGALAAAVRARIVGLERAGLDGAAGARGERLAIVGRPDLDAVVSLLAAMERGVPVVLLHPRWTPAERARALALARPRLVLDTEHPDAAPSAGDEGHGARGDVHGDRALAIVFTSGTSGEPRAAVLSRRAFLAAAHASAAVLGWREGDAWLCAMPLAHVGGLSIVVRALVARRAIVLGEPGPFEPQRFVAALAARRATLASVVPTMLARVVERHLRPPSSLRAVLVGGAACPPGVLEGACALGWPLRTTYGLTEACAQVATAREDVVDASAGSGPPLPGVEVRIRAEDERILVRSPSLMDGWLRADGTLERPFDEDGFYDTGDDGRLDARGNLHVLGRRTDLVVTGGENVRPAEVEAALEAIPGVRAACVFGVPDPTWGAVVAAAVVTEPGGGPTDVEIARALRDRLAPFKVPRRIERVPALVTAASGKLDRAATASLALGRVRS